MIFVAGIAVSTLFTIHEAKPKKGNPVSRIYGETVIRDVISFTFFRELITRYSLIRLLSVKEKWSVCLHDRDRMSISTSPFESDFRIAFSTLLTNVFALLFEPFDRCVVNCVPVCTVAEFTIELLDSYQVLSDQTFHDPLNRLFRPKWELCLPFLERVVNEFSLWLTLVLIKPVMKLL